MEPRSSSQQAAVKERQQKRRADRCDLDLMHTGFASLALCFPSLWVMPLGAYLLHPVMLLAFAVYAIPWLTIMLLTIDRFVHRIERKKWLMLPYTLGVHAATCLALTACVTVIREPFNLYRTWLLTPVQLALAVSSVSSIAIYSLLRRRSLRVAR